MKFSTNGTRLTAERARQLAALDYLDVQISIDGATAATNDAVRGEGSFAAARTAMDNLAAAGFGPFKVSVVVTRQNVEELDALAAIADGYGAQLRLTRLRPSGRAVDTWDALHPTAAQQRTLYHWLVERPGRPDRRLLLPPLGSGRAARRLEPVRRGTSGMPRRSCRRCLRVPPLHAARLVRRGKCPGGLWGLSNAFNGSGPSAPIAVAARRGAAVPARPENV